MILQAGPDSSIAVRVTLAVILILHIGGGAVGLLSGAASLIVRKGSRLHRIAGNTFFVSMLIMSAIGAGASPFLPTPAWNNVVAGVFTCYLVATSWMTVRRKDGVGLFETAALIVACAIVVLGTLLGLHLSKDPTLRIDKSAGPIFIFVAIAALAAAGDLKMILNGGVVGARRIARHLWRMCLALLIGATSLFLGQPQLFSPAVHASHVLLVPEIAVIAAMIYWVFRVRLAANKI